MDKIYTIWMNQKY